MLDGYIERGKEIKELTRQLQQANARIAELEGVVEQAVDIISDYAPGHTVWLEAAAQAKEIHHDSNEK